MNATTVIIFSLYFIIIALLGWMGFRKTNSKEDFLVGGRRMKSFVMSLSYGATFISASAIVGFGGVSATFGMGIEWLCMLNMLMGVIVAFLVFGKKTRTISADLGANSFPSFLGKFYKSRHIQVFMAVIIILGMPLYSAVVMKGGAVFIEQIFSVEYNVALLIFTGVIAVYVIAGGMKGVMYTDAFQSVIMFSCMFALAFGFYRELGVGFAEGNRQLSELAGMVSPDLQSLGHRGWTSMPAPGSPQWYTLITSLILGVGIGCLAQPQLVVKFMTIRSNRELNRGIVIGCVFLLVTVGVIYHVSAMSNLYFFKKTGMVTSQLVPDADKIVPFFIKSSMPEWFTAVFMMCIIAAGMSTLASQVHTMGVAAGSDLAGRGSRGTRFIRFAVLISVLISYGVCYLLKANVIARGTNIFMGLCACTFLPAYFCALYWKRVTRQGAIASMWVGAVTSLFALFFLHRKESAALGICKAVFGTDCLASSFPWDTIDPILYSFPLSVISIIVVSLLTQNESE